jgi:hypothetical protein
MSIPETAMILRRPPRRALLGVPLVLIALTAACESDSSGPSGPPAPGTITVNASSATAYVWLSFDGDTLAVVASPGPSDWDIALRRYTAKLNGGVAGTKGVLGYNLANNAAADTAEILAFTPANQLAAFQAVSEADIPDDGAFTSEGLGPDFAGWFRFDPVSNGLVANPAAAWKIALASGGHAVFRVGRIVASMTALDSVTFEWRLADQAGNLGTATSLTVGTSGGQNAVSFTTGAAVAATGCGFDVSAGAAFLVTVNGACGAGTFPLDVSEGFATIARADDAPAYGPFLALISGPIPSSFTDHEAPFLYNLAGDNRLSPTFNIYLVKVGASVYKVQFTGYYDAGGASGYPTLRYAKLR